ncbi:hypothetical protein [Paenibacillus tarimensis]|uniref:hypothetical protein n=1 Tax=Paenibacillus tarimensis TaxID=416012 RepID=UPI001F3149D7|nr:hypothetical protein [Paenibacillus tarimensis]MCF2946427.1 hypothetical protein [Paenibacillus tarimensis]
MKLATSYNTAFTHRTIWPSVRRGIFEDARAADNPALAKSYDPPLRGLSQWGFVNA